MKIAFAVPLLLINSLIAASTTPAPNETDPRLGLPSWENDSIRRAFPGAEGGGMFTSGGRGATVYRVTRLDDDPDDPQPGTFRHAVNREGARTIVFETGGIIDLKGTLTIRNGDLTIAGQTAPGDGICIRNYGVVIDCDNAIIRYMRFRLGDEYGQEADALEGRGTANVIVDHCSMSWSTDECASFYQNRDFTMQWCIISESLRNSVHEKGTHGYGGIWGGMSVSFHHNLLAHHDSRNPRFDSPDAYAPSWPYVEIREDERTVDYRNCVVYNFGGQPAYGGGGQRVNFVGNYYKWGPASRGGAGVSLKPGPTYNTVLPTRREYFYILSGDETSLLFHDDNSNRLDPDNKGINGYNAAGFVYSGTENGAGFTFLARPVPITPGGIPVMVTCHTAAEAYDAVLEYGGCSNKRDRVDSRVVFETRSGTSSSAGSNGSMNGMIDSQRDVGGWPAYDPGTPETDSDGDGIPDWWEDEFGLDKLSAADGNDYNLDPGGRYTNLKIYLYWLVRDQTLGANRNGEYIQLK